MTSGGCDLDHSSNSAASLWLTFKPAISSNLFLSTAPCCVLVACTQPEIELHRQSGCFIGNIAGRGYVARLWSSHVHLTAVTHMPRSPAPPPPFPTFHTANDKYLGIGKATITVFRCKNTQFQAFLLQSRAKMS